MNLINRIGYDAGANRLEDALAFAGEHGFHYLAFRRAPDRIGSIIGLRNVCEPSEPTWTLTKSRLRFIRRHRQQRGFLMSQRRRRRV